MKLQRRSLQKQQLLREESIVGNNFLYFRYHCFLSKQWTTGSSSCFRTTATTKRKLAGGWRGRCRWGFAKQRRFATKQTWKKLFFFSGFTISLTWRSARRFIGRWTTRRPTKQRRGGTKRSQQRQHVLSFRWCRLSGRGGGGAFAEQRRGLATAKREARSTTIGLRGDWENTSRATSIRQINWFCQWWWTSCRPTTIQWFSSFRPVWPVQRHRLVLCQIVHRQCAVSTAQKQQPPTTIENKSIFSIVPKKKISTYLSHSFTPHR